MLETWQTYRIENTMGSENPYTSELGTSTQFACHFSYYDFFSVIFLY